MSATLATGATANISLNLTIDVSDLSDFTVYFKNLETGEIDLEKTATVSTQYLTCKIEATDLTEVATYKVYGQANDGNDFIKCVESDILEIVPEGGN